MIWSSGLKDQKKMMGQNLKKLNFVITRPYKRRTIFSSEDAADHQFHNPLFFSSFLQLPILILLKKTNIHTSKLQLGYFAKYCLILDFTAVKNVIIPCIYMIFLKLSF